MPIHCLESGHLRARKPVETISSAFFEQCIFQCPYGDFYRRVYMVYEPFLGLDFTKKSIFSPKNAPTSIASPIHSSYFPSDIFSCRWNSKHNKKGTFSWVSKTYFQGVCAFSRSIFGHILFKNARQCALTAASEKSARISGNSCLFCSLSRPISLMRKKIFSKWREIGISHLLTECVLALTKKKNTRLTPSHVGNFFGAKRKRRKTTNNARE